mmetsp:Transcript_26524/g.4637  ORF Transcript_26524/g.4637 Transcript_26524/m.4637 type:complete len:119 (+) Transcript_26524:1565-1921(+)
MLVFDNAFVLPKPNEAIAASGSSGTWNSTVMHFYSINQLYMKLTTGPVVFPGATIDISEGTANKFTTPHYTVPNNYTITVYIIDNNKNLVEKSTVTYGSMTASVTTGSNLTINTTQLA